MMKTLMMTQIQRESALGLVITLLMTVVSCEIRANIKELLLEETTNLVLAQVDSTKNIQVLNSDLVSTITNKEWDEEVLGIYQKDKVLPLNPKKELTSSEEVQTYLDQVII